MNKVKRNMFSRSPLSASFVVLLAGFATLFLTQPSLAQTDTDSPAIPPQIQEDVHTREGVRAVLRGPVDDEQYVGGPGDGFAITLWAQNVLSMRETVTPEGELVIAGVATIDVAGKRLDQVKADIRAHLGKLYRNVKVSVSLIELRKILVNIVGDVAAPGTYTGTALDLTSDLIKKMGGLGEEASWRNIVITRRDGTQEKVDLIRYRNVGDFASNPPILDGDVIFVPRATSFVFINGTVARPGRYEFVEGETIGSLLQVAGGLARGAVGDTVELREFVDSVTTRSVLVDLSRQDGRDYLMSDGDQVYVRSIPEWRKVKIVELEGEFIHPGLYGVNEGIDRIADIIERGGGFTREASLYEANLIRSKGVDEVDLEFERLKTVPVEEMNETEYAYFKTKSRERKGIVVVDFEKLMSGEEWENILLKDGDRIVVPKKRETVAVSGQVAHPGNITYTTGKKASYYIERAGGYSPNASKGKTKVIKGATGEWLSEKKAGVLLPRDVVWVPEKPERDLWKFVQDVARFTASIATVYLVVDQATRN